jgi:RimJ/RimL family protein N-acetyltransferase
MAVDLRPLSDVVLNDDRVRLEPMAACHIEPLRRACELDQAIWDIYPFSMLGEHFDTAMAALHDDATMIRFAVIEGRHDQLIGMSSYIRPDSHGVVEIGGTYIVPAERGTGINRAMKRLMIDHAFACGFRRIEFRVDTRNRRSMAAVAKLGAKHEGTLRQNRVTWTGYVRDTAIFGLLKAEWQA